MSSKRLFRFLMLCGALAMLLALAASPVLTARRSPPPLFSDAEWAVIKTLSPLPEKPPVDWTNAFADDPAAAKLGQELFFDPAIAGPLRVGTDMAQDLNGNP